MRRKCGIALVIVMLAHAGGSALSPEAPAGGAGPEQGKVIEQLKLQLLLLRGEDVQFHDALEKLMRKYPDDPDVKSLRETYDTYHLMKGYSSTR